MQRPPGPRVIALGILVASLFAASAVAASLAPMQVPFVENCGQWDARVAFAAETGFGTVFVTREGQLVYSLGDESSLVETAISGTAAPRSGRASVTRVSYFHGDDRARWQTGLPSYDEIGLGEVWPGVTVSLVAGRGNVEKLFTIAPGASVRKIRLRLDGAGSLRIDTDGALVARTSRGDVRFSPPVAYQEITGARTAVAAAYTRHGARYGFRLGHYDRSRPVIVDPLLQATYLGGSDRDFAHVLAIQGTSGEVIVAGLAASPDFPGTAGGAQPGYGGFPTAGDGFVARLDPTLTTLLQATYLGGGLSDSISALAVDPATGDVVVAGSTYSSNFPGTAGGAQPAPSPQGDTFVARLNSSLTSLRQATYLGGSYTESAMGVAIHPSTGEVVVAGNTGSDDFPGTAGGAQPLSAGGGDVFIARLLGDLTTLLQATYVGGSASEYLEAMAVHPTSGDILVTGSTESIDLPVAAGGAQPGYGGGVRDGFVARVDSTLTALLQATYLGGTELDIPRELAIDPSTGDILVAGYTVSVDFPGVAGGAQPVSGGSDEGFVSRLDASLTTLRQSTYLGGADRDRPNALTVHPASGEVLVVGWTASTNFPGTDGAAQPVHRGGNDGFVARLDPTLGTLLRGTFVGGTGEDEGWGITVNPANGEVLVAGETGSTDFFGTSGGAQPSKAGTFTDAFVARLTPDLTAILSPTGMVVDSQPDPGDGDFMFEAGEEVPILPVWQNLSGSPEAPGGQASDFTSATDATYTIHSDTVSYGAIPPGGMAFPGTPYVLSVSQPTARPVHWDVRFTETLNIPTVIPRRWKIHVGESFLDVPRSNIYYPSIETVLHNGVSSGCGAANYCPAASTTRDQMASFLLLTKHGSRYSPPPCTGIFTDVPCAAIGPSRWIEQLFREGITAGCGVDIYCPSSPVTREQMAVFLLKTLRGADHVPPACSGRFSDVACPSLFADWIEELAATGITAGCGNGTYCPDNPITRGQMAVFLVKAYGLRLYGP